MFTRSLSVLAGVLVVAGTLAVASALATDEPTPPVQGTTRACVDNMRPLSRLRVGWQGGFRRGVIRGIAIDQGCGAAGAGKVKSVDVAISRRVGTRCQHLRRNGKLGRASSCTTHIWLRAKGSKAWSFRLRHQLPRGKYLVSTRAIDAAGNIETRGHR
jgi:hypothetical protein